MQELSEDDYVGIPPRMHYVGIPTREHLCKKILRPDQEEELRPYTMIAARMDNLNHMNPWVHSLWAKDGKFFHGYGVDHIWCSGYRNSVDNDGLPDTYIPDSWKLREIDHEEARNILKISGGLWSEQKQQSIDRLREAGMDLVIKDDDV